jgi:5-methylthioadenosine/S-adenosylhomocysteine deaminase
MSIGSTLIHDALVVPCDDERPPFVGWVEVTGTHISAMGEGSPGNALTQQLRIDASGSALLPGFVNTHAHSHSSLTRGTAEGMALEDWIATIEREQRQLTDEDAYVAALVTYGEALLSGTTTMLDMCLRPQAAMRAAEAIGIRVAIAPYVLDKVDFAPKLSDVRALLAQHSATRGRISLWVGLHDLESCDDDTIRAGSALASEFNTGLHLHCAETRFARDRTRARTGRTPIGQLAALGVLGPRTVLAHCVWTDADDIELLSSAKAVVAHCPHANLKLASGFAPVPEMIIGGVRVAIATDGAKANNRLDMFDVMKFTSLLHKGRLLNASAMSAQEVLGMGTRLGAQALGVDAGVIAPGKLADLTLVDLQQFHLQPALPETVVTNLVHSARGADVRLVMVGGEVTVRDGRLVNVELSSTLSAMKAAARRLMQ